MRVLIVTRQFPNSTDPTFSPFNRQQFAALADRCDVEVLASIPWFPGARLFSRWSLAGRLASVPREERIGRLPVKHPRDVQIPKIGWSVVQGVPADHNESLYSLTINAIA